MGRGSIVSGGEEGLYQVKLDFGTDRMAMRALQVGNELRQALERDEIVPYYQPIVDLRTGRVVWHNLLVDQAGDLRDEPGARETADDLLKNLGVPPKRGGGRP